ncbi:MAG: hypothetical protein H7841_17315, partial [Magnetospirillum sp. WYHS-4]
RQRKCSTTFFARSGFQAKKPNIFNRGLSQNAPPLFKLGLTGEFPFGVFLNAAVNVKSNNRLLWPAFMTSNPQFAPLATELQSVVDLCLRQNPLERPTADALVSLSEELCYIDLARHTAVVNNIIQSGYSAFAAKPGGETVFFSMESLYGAKRNEVKIGSMICYCSFEGRPRFRAHPVTIINNNANKVGGGG